MKTSKNKLQDYGPVLMSTQVIVVAFKSLYRNVSAPYFGVTVALDGWEAHL